MEFAKEKSKALEYEIIARNRTTKKQKSRRVNGEDIKNEGWLLNLMINLLKKYGKEKKEKNEENL